MANFIYTPYKNSMLVAGANPVDWDADNVNASLVRASTYTPNQTTHDFYDDVTTPVAEASAFLVETVSGFNVDVADFSFTAVGAGA